MQIQFCNSWFPSRFPIHIMLYKIYLKWLLKWNGCSKSIDPKFTMKFQHMNKSKHMHKPRYIKHFSGAIGQTSSSTALIWYHLSHSPEALLAPFWQCKGGSHSCNYLLKSFYIALLVQQDRNTNKVLLPYLKIAILTIIARLLIVLFGLALTISSGILQQIISRSRRLKW